MKVQYSIRISLIVCILVLCTCWGIYSFLRLNMLDQRTAFNLYTLVPQDVEVVFETDKLTDLMESIDRMDCSRDKHFLHASELFTCVKDYVRVLMSERPHGLSAQMNEMIISFHPSDLKNNQVLYCKLGLDDRKLLENYIHRYGTLGYPSKTFRYRGRTIEIFPLADGRFLSLWIERDFLVVSFQKHLVEQVIDAWKNSESLAHLDSFRSLTRDKREAREAVLFMRWRSPDEFGGAMVKEDVADLWIDFEMKFAEVGLFCTGTTHGLAASDTCRYVFASARPLDGFLSVEIPGSAFMYRSVALPEKDASWYCSARSKTDSLSCAAAEYFADYLSSYVEGSALSCLFLSDKSVGQVCSVVALSVKDVSSAQEGLHRMLYTVSQGRYPFYKSLYVPGMPVRLRVFRLPSVDLPFWLAGHKGRRYYTHACFYGERLVLSAGEEDLLAYIRSLQHESGLGAFLGCNDMEEQLSAVYDFLQVVDLESAMNFPSECSVWIPPFFISHADFFRHFYLAVQLCRVDGVVSPSIILLYKAEQALSGN